MPAAPTGVAIAEQAIFHIYEGALLNRGAALMTFTNNAATAQHRIERQNASAEWVLAVIVGPTAASAIVPKLLLNQVNNLRIRSEDEAGVSAWVTTTVTVPAMATEIDPPLAPNSLTVGGTIGVRSYDVELVWEDTSDDEAYFILEIRRGTSEIKTKQFLGMTETALVDLTTMFPADSVPQKFYTARVKAIGGQAGSKKLPPWSSAWSNEVTFKTGDPDVRITSPLTASGEIGVAFSYQITSNVTPSLGYGAPGLPDGLTLIDPGTGEIAGTPTTAGEYDVELSADNGGVPDTKHLIITIVPSSITFTTPMEAEAFLWTPFEFQVRARRSGGTAPINYTMLNAPAWLTISASGLMTGTPTSSGEFFIQLNATDGTRNGTGVFTLTVAEFAIISDDEVTKFVNLEFTHQMLATGEGATWEVDDLAPAWLTIDPTTGLITGTPTEIGEFEVNVTATLNVYADTQTLLIKVVSLITVPEGCIAGNVDEPLLELVKYNGDCEIEQWVLTGHPPGVTLGTVECGPYGEENQKNVAITGTPTAPGFYNGFVIAQLCCQNVPSLYKAPICFHINGGLFLDWLHDDVTLFDLQFQIRGDTVKRVVHSYYEVEETAAGQATVVQENTSGEAPTTSKTTTTEVIPKPATPGNLLTLKRGDFVRLAILPRDGKDVVTDGITNVKIVFRTPDSTDLESLWDKTAVLTTEGENEYFLVEFLISHEMLDDIMADDSVLGSLGGGAVAVLAEIRYTLGGHEFSTVTFRVNFVEDVAR